jgi:hypothetical protein
MDHILYTYQLNIDAPGGQVCRAYGPATQAAALAEGEKLRAEQEHIGNSPLQFMVLPLEAMPA